jgi:hypothetical protein
MSVIFDYAVSFSEKELVPSISSDFLRKVGVFVKPKAASSVSVNSSDVLVITDESKTSKSSKPKVDSSEYVMIEALETTYSNFTSNTEIQGFFDSGMNSIFLLMLKADASAIPESKDLDVNEIMTICYSSDFTYAESKEMLVDGFKGTYAATGSTEAEAVEFQALSKNHVCFLDSSATNKAYGMCAAFGYHLTRNYWRNNQYYSPPNPTKIGGVTSSDYGRVLLGKGVSFYLTDKKYGTYLGFFGNQIKGIAKPYIYEEIKLKSQEALTLWNQKNEPTDTVMNRILAERAANEPLREFEGAPYYYLDPDFKNKVAITKSSKKYHANGAMEIRIPNPAWVYDIETTVSN